LKKHRGCLPLDYTLKCQKFDDMSDRDLVDAVIREEKDAEFCLFHHKLRKLFLHLSNEFSKLRYDAGDIASEVYILLKENNWKKLRSFEFRSSILNWIRIVASRYLLNETKKTFPRINDVFFFSCLIEQGEEEEYNPIENIPDPYQIFIEEMRDNEDLIDELYESIDSLNAYMREIAQLRGLSGLLSKETAEILCKCGKEITPGAVDQAFKRAKDTIKKNLLDRRA
jgi:RNA polymerase sigma factor (sigma-70 family)